MEQQGGIHKQRLSSSDALASVLAQRQPCVTTSPDDAFWREVALEAQRRGLCGLVLEHAAAAGVQPPDACVAPLRSGVARVAAEQLNMIHELQCLLRAFNRAGVPVMLLKGAGLIQNVYAEPGLRPMSDLDLLVRPEHVEAATKILERAGCRRGAEVLRDDFFPRFYYEQEWLTNAPRPVRIDLHARPLRPLRVSRTMPDDALWQGAVPVEVGGATAWLPQPEAMFVHLCAHAAFHGCIRLIWVYDLARFARHHADMDWTLVLSLCWKWRLSLPVRTAIEHARRSTGIACPDEVIEALRTQRCSWRDRLVLWQSPKDAERPLLHVLVNTVSTPDVRHAVAYLIACLCPSRAHLADVYPWRHRGWHACALLWRLLRAPARLLASPLT